MTGPNENRDPSSAPATPPPAMENKEENRMRDIMAENAQLRNQIKKEGELSKRITELESELEATSCRSTGTAPTELGSPTRVDELRDFESPGFPIQPRRQRTNSREQRTGRSRLSFGFLSGSKESSPSDSYSTTSMLSFLGTPRADEYDIERLRREKEMNEEAMAKLRSDLVHVRARYKDDQYRSNGQIAQLSEENAALAVKIEALERELKSTQITVQSTAVRRVDNTKSKLRTAEPKVEVELGSEGSDDEITVRDAPASSKSYEIHDATNTIKNLEQRIQILQKQKLEYESTIERLNNAVSQLNVAIRKESSKSFNNVQELRKKNAELTMRIKSLERELMEQKTVLEAHQQCESTLDHVTSFDEPPPPPEEHVRSAPCSPDSSGRKSILGARSFESPLEAGQNRVDRLKSEIQERDAKILQLEHAAEANESKISVLKAELSRMRMSFTNESYKSKRELRSLQAENDAKALRVSVLEREFKEVNKEDETRVNSAYLQGLVDDLEKSKALIRELESQVWTSARCVCGMK